MSSFSIFIDDHGLRWQFKTGYDSQDEYRLGDEVPYKKNEDLALDIQWEDQVIAAICESDNWVHSQFRWIVIKGHRVASTCAWDISGPGEQEQHDNHARFFEIYEPELRDWEAEAIIAYYKEQIAAQRRWIKRRDAMAKTAGKGWHRSPGALTRLRMTEHSLMHRIMPPKKLVSAVDAEPPPIDNYTRP